MSKEDMIEILQKEGFPAIFKDGVVYVDKALGQDEVDRLHEILLREKYCESYGFRRAPGLIVPDMAEEAKKEKPAGKGKRKKTEVKKEGKSARSRTGK